MIPEQALGEELEARTDLFSFGVALYEMSTADWAPDGNVLAVVNTLCLQATPMGPLPFGWAKARLMRFPPTGVCGGNGADCRTLINQPTT